ncbi:TetR/AcrR family transcriptional regulator [Herbiconiux sp. YIM B11900]|uniref:TetR/AcrR family transcriptional regulator n=1 Tax=Herbiconiux sp. YIM B11900 TaxID=3404131 RepID=UPI003F857282
MARPTGPRGESRRRLLDAALGLFSRHGVNGTSLQMIADALGVTKAAVYHQYNSKDEIVIAVATPALEQMDRIVSEAEAEAGPRERFDAMLDGLVELVLDHREFAASLQRDPEMGRLLRADDRYTSLTDRFDLLLIGDQPTPAARVALAAAGGGLMVAGVDPALAGIDRETVRRVLRESAAAVLAPYLPSANPANVQRH